MGLDDTTNDTAAAAGPGAAKAQAKAPVLTFPETVADHVREVYAGAERILEYGSGGSTVLAAERGAEVLSIESDRGWARRMRAYFAEAGADPERVRVQWINVGPTRKWGYPADARGWKRYPNYAFHPWEKEGFSPDVVLIDGRFRLACLAATMLHCTRETRVLFDDYFERDFYRQAEAFWTVEHAVGRMAEFRIAPRAYSGAEFATILRWFFRAK